MTPKIGMPVLYHPHPDDHFTQYGGQPLHAVIAYVWRAEQDGGCVNLLVVDHKGLMWNRESVLFWPAPDGAVPPIGGRWCQANVQPPRCQRCVTLGPDPMAGNGLAEISRLPPGSFDRIQCGGGS